MAILILLSLFISLPVLAIEGVVVVLEAPLFHEPDDLSKIVQYTRKGDKIYLHPSTRHNNYANENIELDLETEEQEQDSNPIFSSYKYHEGDAYLMTLTKRGRPAYIKREHVEIYFEDARELSQQKLNFDPTDYRIEEPLPNGYPIAQLSGYRGSILIGTGTKNKTRYPFSNVESESNGNRLGLMAIWAKQIEFDESGRFFFGGMTILNSFDRKVSLTSGNTGREEHRQFGVGPYISYDPFQSDEHVISINFSISANLINSVRVLEESSSGLTETEFNKISITPRLGVMYQKKKVFRDFLDFAVMGTMSLEPSYTYNSSNSNAQVYKNELTLDLGLFAGFQSAY